MSHINVILLKMIPCQIDLFAGHIILRRRKQELSQKHRDDRLGRPCRPAEAPVSVGIEEKEGGRGGGRGNGEGVVDDGSRGKRLGRWKKEENERWQGKGGSEKEEDKMEGFNYKS